MVKEYIRDYTMYAAVFGFFSAVWFGWAQEKPREKWRIYLRIATVVAVVVSLLGFYLSGTHWNAASMLNEGTNFKTYLIIFYGEMAIGGAGAVGLFLLKRQQYISAWIALIVGIHFIALESVFADSSLYVLAAFLILIALGSPFAAGKLKVAISAVTGIASGLTLLVYALSGLVRFVLAVS